MPGDQKLWSMWPFKAAVAQPVAPAHQGSGFPHPTDPNTIRWGSPNRDSLSGLAPTPDEATAGYAAAELCRVTDNIEHARDEQDLLETAQAAFGPDSFSERFGKAQSGATNCRHHLELQRLMVRAELQDHLSGRVAWPPGGNRGSDFHGPELWQVGRHLRFARINLLCNQALLKKAAASRDALLTELAVLFAKGDDTWASIRGQLKPETLQHWAKYAELTQTNNTADRGKAGELLGLVMLAVLPAVAAQRKTVVSTENLAGTAPELLGAAIKFAQGS